VATISLRNMLTSVAEIMNDKEKECKETERAFTTLCLRIMGVPDGKGPDLNDDSDGRVLNYINGFRKLLRILDINPYTIYIVDVNDDPDQFEDERTGEWKIDNWEEIFQRGKTVHRNRYIHNFIMRLLDSLVEKVPEVVCDDESLLDVTVWRDF
jgi:hypothetical protein